MVNKEKPRPFGMSFTQLIFLAEPLDLFFHIIFSSYPLCRYLDWKKEWLCIACPMISWIYPCLFSQLPWNQKAPPSNLHFPYIKKRPALSTGLWVIQLAAE